MTKWFRKHGTTILLYLSMILGLGFLLYPTISDVWNRLHQSYAIASYESIVRNMDNSKIEEMLEEARSFNEKIYRSGEGLLISDQNRREYYSILDVSGTGIMGYVKIDKINVKFPIYHGTGEAVLQIAVGHLEGSSFPVDGKSTHVVLSGHRGLPSARLFTDLDQLQKGDTFDIIVLDETLTYKVDQITVVEPHEVDDLKIEYGKKYCTLVTCTPYGVNSHRLLIRGEYVEKIVVEEEVTVKANAQLVPVYLPVMAVFVPVLFMILLYFMIHFRRKESRVTRKQLKELMKQYEDV